MNDQATAVSLESRLDQIESRTAINDLVAGYCEGVDRRDLAKFVSLWHDDAAYLIPGGRGDFYGLDGIKRSQEVIAAAWKQTFHWTTNHTVEFESADKATGRSDCFAMCQHPDGEKVSMVGCTYLDKYERRVGTWKFAERYVNRWFVSAGEDIALLAPF
jgi:gamma-hexachlorocyclohexane dehydrochlorinase